MNQNTYNKILRILAVLCASYMLWVSATFSVSGFNIIVKDKEYIGWGLAAVIIIVEMIWNKVGIKGGFTLFSAGLLCYFYGIYTNITGVVASADFLNTQGVQEIFASTILGLFLEIVPEPLFVWGLVGMASDPIGNLINKNSSTVESDDPYLRSMLDNRKRTRKYFNLEDVFPDAKR